MQAMFPTDQFVEDILDAYEHLYDIAYLCESSLLDLLITDRQLSATQQARQLHDLLTTTIEELDPGPKAPISSREWRRHRLLMLRYIDGLTTQAVSDQLSISRRHFYREHREALEVVANILWQRLVAPVEQVGPSSNPADKSPGEERLELMRLEAARLDAASAGQPQHHAHFQDVLRGVLSLIQVMAEHKALRIEVKVGKNVPNLGHSTVALRQILLGLLSYLIENQTGGAIRIKAFRETNRLHITLRSSGGEQTTAAEHDERHNATLAELAAMHNLEIQSVIDEAGHKGFDVDVFSIPQRTVLIVEDNEDVGQLFQRFLLKNNYRFVTARTGAEALEAAKTVQPYAITLDVMIPDPDGWSVLQMLRNQLETRHIPVIVCTVLGTKELALSLGAAAFLEKPVTEEALLGALDAIRKLEDS
jgi:CheY-like chemotaxis protein